MIDNPDYPYSVFEKITQIESEHFWYTGRRISVRNLMQKRIKFSNNMRFLEIGAGTGAMGTFLQNHFGGYFVVSEASISALINARKRNPELHYVQLDALNIPYKSDFDVVGMFDVVEHLEDDFKVMREIHQALDKKGYVLLTVPQYSWMWSEHDEMSGHKRRYNRKTLRYLMEKSNFEIVFMSSYLFVAFPLMLIARIFKKKEKISEVSGLEISRFMNKILSLTTRFDAWLIKLGISLPYGGSLIAIGKKNA